MAYNGRKDHEEWGLALGSQAQSTCNDRHNDDELHSDVQILIDHHDVSI